MIAARPAPASARAEQEARPPRRAAASATRSRAPSRAATSSPSSASRRSSIIAASARPVRWRGRGSVTSSTRLMRPGPRGHQHDALGRGAPPPGGCGSRRRTVFPVSGPDAAAARSLHHPSRVCASSAAKRLVEEEDLRCRWPGARARATRWRHAAGELARDSAPRRPRSFTSSISRAGPARARVPAGTPVHLGAEVHVARAPCARGRAP